ncbi:MAG: hypothetical protein RLZZ32_2326 [Cyanobacteriota bacterium]|jgi:hypothetical protein
MYDQLDNAVLLPVADALPSVHQFKALPSAIGNDLPEAGSVNGFGSLYEGFASGQLSAESKVSCCGGDSALKSGMATLSGNSGDPVTGLNWDGSLFSDKQSSDPVKKRRTPEFLSAFWGLDDGIQIQGAPSATALDGMPITFSWLIDQTSIDPSDFKVILSDGTVTLPTAATLRPANESNETQTILLLGDFGDADLGVIPVRVKLVGELIGAPPGSMRSEVFPRLVSPSIRNLSAGPYIVDAWRIPSGFLANDANASTVGSTSIRIVWAGGITDYPTGAEVGDDVTRAYRLTYVYRGRNVTLAPLDLGDLNDGDNMHDLSFPAIPSGAKLKRISLPRRLVEDPNGDPNPAQRFRLR